MKQETSFFERVITTIRKIPRGKVATYGQIAALAGKPRAARQVAWILHSSSDKHRLPWHRVINRNGKISLPKYGGYEVQRALLVKEKIVFDENDRIDSAKFQWRAGSRR